MAGLMLECYEQGEMAGNEVEETEKVAGEIR